MLKRTIILILTVAVIIAGIAIVNCNHSAKTLSVELPDTVTLYRKEAGRIVSLTYEELLIGCLFGDVSPSYGEEALKAAACAMNCRILCVLQEGMRYNGARLTDEEYPWLSPEAAEAEYGSSYSSYLRKITNAVNYGMSHVLVREGKIVPAPVCRISTGMTEDGGEWLQPKELLCDRNNDEGLSTSACSVNELRRILTKITGVSKLSADPSEWFSNAIYTDGGTLTEIRFGGARLTGEQLQEIFGLRSAAITVEYSEGRFLFTVRGIGSNTGMSLNAAAEMASSGMTAEEILAYFYSPAQLYTIS